MSDGPLTSGLPSATVVYYIVHRDYGTAPVARFVESYRQHPAGAGHSLVIACKAFEDCTDKGAFTSLFGGLDHRIVDVPADGYDIGTYLHLYSLFPADAVVLLNTNATFLADNWLAKLLGAFTDKQIGVAGATGSLQSMAGHELRHRNPAPMPHWQSSLRMGLRFLRTWRQFPMFPNPHLRTNGIVVPAAVMERVANMVIRTTRDAAVFESGRAGLPRIVRQMGLRAVVVDRDGIVYDEEDWQASNTFWTEDQGNLMISDNRTAIYEHGDEAERGRLRSLAWSRP